MAEELIRACEKLNLSEKEEKTIAIVDEENELKKKQISLRLVGKLLINKPFSKPALKSTLSLVWKPQFGLVIREIESNLFVFQFFNEIDKQKVIEGMPWTFDDFLVLLKDIDANIKPSEITFTDSPMWVKIYDLPLRSRNFRTAETIGNHIGKFLEFDDSDILGLDRTLKIKVLVDITKPLMRGITLDVGGTTSWFDIKYVRMPIVCYSCGMLGHVEKECPVLEEADNHAEANQYGPWLRASPLKPRSKPSSKEVEKEKLWLMKLKERENRRENKECVGKGENRARKLNFEGERSNLEVSEQKGIEMEEIEANSGGKTFVESTMETKQKSQSQEKIPPFFLFF